MKKSFRDPVTNVLKAHGYMSTNAVGDLMRDEPDDFNLEPGKWKWDGVAWVANSPTLAEKQAATWEKIMSERTRRENGGVLVTVSAAGVTPAVTKWFYTVVTERLRYMGAARKGAALTPVQWKTMDGTFVTMDSTLVGAVIDAIEAADRTNFANAETHRTNMLAAADPTTYNYSTGWTAIYQ